MLGKIFNEKVKLNVRNEAILYNSSNFLDALGNAVLDSTDISNREKAILNNLDAIEIYNPNDYMTVAEFYNNEGEGFQMVIDAKKKKGFSYHRPGSITQ